MNREKLLSITASLAMSFSLLSSTTVSATSAEKITANDGYIMGVKPMDEETLEKYRETLVFDNEYTRAANTRDALPSSVDLSTSKYFPPIGNQGVGFGSCVAWATTYYQFTYEVNKLRDTAANTNSNIFSPAWSWNYCNKGVQSEGSNSYETYQILEQRGATTIDVMPYNPSNYNYGWVTNQDDLLEALSIRKKPTTNAISISGQNTVITSNTDSDLNAVKTALNSGKVLNVETHMKFNQKLSTNSETVAYRFYTDTGINEGHSLTVVGYNDNIQCDVNGNGTIEPSEKGAFKVANSWGASWENNGFFWVLYDSLNGLSANTTNSWESSLTGTRKGAFVYNSVIYDTNTFRTMDVEEKELNFVGRLDLATNYRNLIYFSTYINNNSFDAYYSLYDETIFPFNGPILVDFNNCPNGDDPYTNYSGKSWQIRFNGKRDLWVGTSPAFRIIDNKGNTISNFGTLSSTLNSQTINLQKGDLNYDGTINIVDLATLNQYVNGGDSNLSNVAKCLADFDNNHIVNSADLNTLSNMLLN